MASDELFDDEIAEAFRLKAARIAESMKLALFFRLERTSPGDAADNMR